MTTDTEHLFTITNTCVCESWDDEASEWSPSYDCFGCWDEAKDDFLGDTKPLFESDNFTGWWKIEGFPVWYGTIGGIFTANNADALLEAITPDRTEWTLRYRVEGETLVGTLSHHDAPTGGRITVTMTSDPNE